MSSTIFPLTIIEPSGEHQATLIYLHGLTSSGSNASHYFTEKLPNLKYIFPSSPVRKVPAAGNKEMTAWFNIPDFSEGGQEDGESIHESALEIHKIIDEEIKNSNISSDRIFLGGNSLGCSLALYAAFTYAEPLAGIVAFRAFIVQEEKLLKLKSVNNTIPLFHGHGENDDVIPTERSQRVFASLQKLTPNATYHLYPAGHRTCDQEIRDVNEFLMAIINGKSIK